MIKFLFICFVLCLNVACFLFLTTTTAKILTPIYVGCFQSYSSCDVFNQTLTLSDCNSLANLITGGWCWSGNCIKTTCTQSECLIPWGTCSGNTCYQCSAIYNLLYSSVMTNDLCVQICIDKYGFTYAATTWG
jgi:hypothetical protein